MGIFKRFRWLIFIAYTILLYFCYTLPGNQIPPVVARANDKTLHAINFLTLALLAFQAFSYSSKRIFRTHAQMKAVGFSLFYGALLEFFQLKVPGREASFADWIADAFGILIAYGIFRISNRFSQLTRTA